MAGFERSAKKAAIKAGKSAKAFGERAKVVANKVAGKVTGSEAKRTKTKRVIAAVGAAAAVVVAGVAVSRRARKNAKPA